MFLDTEYVMWGHHIIPKVWVEERPLYEVAAILLELEELKNMPQVNSPDTITFVEYLDIVTVLEINGFVFWYRKI